MNPEARTTFAAKRRNDQEHLEERLRPDVIEAVKNDQWSDLMIEVAKEWYLVYRAERGVGTPSIESFLDQIEETLEKTTGDDTATVDRISLWLATAILNHATVEAAVNDPTPMVFEWVTMHDGHVRETHEVVDGQQQIEGEPFTVGGEQLHYPGEPVGDPSVWINCRCALVPILADDAAEEFTTGSTGGDIVTTSTEEPTQAPEVTAIPWHGVLAPEGVWSGDGRMFAPDSLTNRDLPLPLTWQKSSSDGHSGSVTVGRIDAIERVDGLMQAYGVFLSTSEADEVVGLLADFGKFGVSVDADDAEMQMDEETGKATFTKARIASAAIVAIPAFAEAYISLGNWGDEAAVDPTAKPAEEDVCDETSPAYDEAACAEKKAADPEGPPFAGDVEEFVDIAPGRTEDGPGWLTHPVDTDRLRDYWVSGAGAAKIAWGVPGDFDRCRANLAKYVKPEYLNGYCSNRHYDALGVWPGQEAAIVPEGHKAAPAVNLVASATSLAPSAWFTDPGFSTGDGRMVQDIDGTWGCPMRITDEGQIYGHLAKWDVCHTGFSGVCTIAPHSVTDYAYFLTGEVLTDAGSVPVGGITVGGGHAEGRLALRPAAAHYDSTSTVVADVTMGEDEFGIWYAGQIRPSATSEQIYELRAAGAVSGDWREFRGEVTELVAALAVNSPGFQTPRIGIVAGAQRSLVAAGVVVKPESSTLPFDMEQFADAVATAIENREKRRAAMSTLRERVAAPHKQTMAALAARIKGD